ncbi:Farnesyl pyrophosphate synthetase, partial [Tulasnella sp. 427]
IGKIGTDIIDNKCSWPVNIALQKATPEQRRILDENYGVKDSQAEARIKKLYHELDIPTIYQKYEQDSHARVSKLIEQVNETPVDGAPVAMKREVYAAFLRKIYGRAK